MIVLAVPYKSLIRCSINEFINYPPLGFYFILVGATSTRKFERDFNGKIEGNLRKDINSSSNRATFETRKLACLCEYLLQLIWRTRVWLLKDWEVLLGEG